MFGGIYEGRRVLVTGHSGFKGSWLSAWLLRLGARVCGISLRPGYEPNHFSLLDLDLESEWSNILESGEVRSIFADFQPEIVFHLAAQALVRPSYEEPGLTFATNVMGTVNVLESCRETSSVRAVVIVTSDKCYENREWVWGYRENDPMGGFDPYSASKGCAELVTAAYRRSFFAPETFGKTHSTLVASARAGNVIGGGDWAVDRLVPDLMRSAAAHREEPLRSPESVRPWQHVLEPLSGYLQLAGKLYEGKQEFADAWNFGPVPAAAITVREAAAALQRGWPDVRFRAAGDPDAPHEAGQLRLDCSKAQSLLRWHGVWDAETSFRRTAEWYRDFYLHNQVNTPGDFDAYFESTAAAEMEWMK